MALHRYREFQTLARAAGDLREQISAGNAVARVQSVLPPQHRSEPEAFSRMRHESMSAERSMYEWDQH